MSVHKVVLVGGLGVGKTAISMRFRTGQFEELLSPTVGAANSVVDVLTSKGTIKLDLWDTAGHERFRCLTPLYFHCAKAAIIVADLSDKDSLFEALDFFKLLRDKVDKGTRFYLVGNKSDLSDEIRVTDDELLNLASKVGSKIAYHVSAKTGEGINNLFGLIATDLLESEKKMNRTVNVEDMPPKKSCC